MIDLTNPRRRKAELHFASVLGLDPARVVANSVSLKGMTAQWDEDGDPDDPSSMNQLPVTQTRDLTHAEFKEVWDSFGEFSRADRR